VIHLRRRICLITAPDMQRNLPSTTTPAELMTPTADDDSPTPTAVLLTQCWIYT